jgi:hypothetical protein
MIVVVVVVMMPMGVMLPKQILPIVIAIRRAHHGVDVVA